MLHTVEPAAVDTRLETSNCLVFYHSELQDKLKKEKYI